MQPRFCGPRPLVRVLVLLLVGLGAVPPAVASDYHYHYFKEKKQLQLDRGHLAILGPETESPDAVRSFLRGAGFPEPAVKSHGIRGWSLFRLGEASSSSELAVHQGGPGVDPTAQAIARLLSFDSEGRYFFTPVFSGRFGSILPSPTILVRFADDQSGADIAATLAELGIANHPRRKFGGMTNAFKITVRSRSGLDVLELANRLALAPSVIAAEPDMIFSGRSAYFPNDPSFIQSWALYNYGQYGGPPDLDLDAAPAWDRTTGDPLVTTVIIDTGVQLDHPDLLLPPGIDTTDDQGDGGPVNPCDTHGTPMAGIVGSIIDNSLGSVGVAPNAGLVSARAFKSVNPCPGGPWGDDGWESFASWTVDALDWAYQYGARVTNNSNGYGFTSSIIDLKYEETKNLGMVHFASAGNDANTDIWYPASNEFVNAISGLDWAGTLDYISNWGEEIVFTGPGKDIYSTDRTGTPGFTTSDYVPNIGGTSSASAMIAGVAALILSEAPALDAYELENLLVATAEDLGVAGRDDFFGWGLPNAADALEALDLFTDTFESGDVSNWSRTVP